MSEEPIDKGLAEAFGRRDDTVIPASSVLRILQARSTTRLGIHLDSPDAAVDDAPVKVTDEAKALRDPSGRYQLLGEIGRGGVGTVYKGRDQDLGRDVAMKVLKDEFADRPDVLARFVEEAQIGGQLQHPGIVPVYELGLQAGERPYFAMKLVKGETLATQLARRTDATQDRRRLLGVFEQICQTMAYAHARRVVHRDLKPANVMIGAFGEVQVVDWGFAKVLPKGGVADEKESVARATERSVIETVRSQEGSGGGSIAGSMLGTPAYMPPEQALGDIQRVDQRSDVFALGAILCEILTGEPPYRERDGDLVRQAATAALDGAHARLNSCGADPSLATLCRECMSPARRARPHSAAEVAARIGAYLTSVEERARQAEVRAAEARLRHRATLLASTAGLLVLALAAGGWIWLQHEEQTRRTRETRQVATAMNVTSRALGKAQNQSDTIDVTLWDAVDQSAENLALLASSDNVETDVHEQARALLDQVQQESQTGRAAAAQQQRDRNMAERLVDLRMPVDDEPARAAGWDQREWPRLDAEYARAFTEYLGGSLLDARNEPTLAMMRRSGIAVELATSLDHWALVRDGIDDRSDPSTARGTARIREIAALLDGDDRWRAELRTLLPDAVNEREQLEALANRADFDSLTGSGCRVLGEALWRAGARDAAIAVLARAREAHPRDFDLCFQLAFAFERLAEPRWDDVVQYQTVANALRPEHNEVLHRQGIALQRLRRLGEAERVFATLARRDSRNAHWFSHLGEVQDVMGKEPEAAESYRTAYELDPDNRRHLNNYGLMYFHQGELGEAISYFERAIAADSYACPSYTNLGNALNALGKYDEALAAYQSALRIDPRYYAANLGIGNVLRSRQQLAEAHEEFTKALGINDRDPLVLASIGASSLALGRVADSIAHSRAALEIDPTLGAAHFTLGQANDMLGQKEEALERYRQAAACKLPAEHLNNLGSAILQHEQYEEAMALFRRSIEADPGLPNAHVSLGDAHRMQEQYERAIACYEAAIAIIESYDVRPHGMLVPHVQAYNNMGGSYASLGRNDEAIPCFERALRIQPDYPNAHVQLGEQMWNRGDFDKAIAHFQRGAELFSALPPTSFNLFWRDEALRHTETVERQRDHFEKVVRGELEASSSAEWQRVVRIAYRHGRHREVVMFTERTLQHAAELIDGDPAGAYNSACSAALLAADPRAEESAAERSRLRDMARSWLSRTATTAPRDLLDHALSDPDFASVRGEALESLPAAELTGWRELWSTIERATTR